MDKKTFNRWNWIVAIAVFVISAATYLSTIEPTASFWDCGEFIASSYKLEVGHPPGNPVFQLIARFFTLGVKPEHAAVAVNAMNAILSALTIFFLYLTIVFFAKRLAGSPVKPGMAGSPGNLQGNVSAGTVRPSYTMAQAIAIMGSGAVGALAYCFSDTFWFSAVEGEVYAMSSLFTALVFWAMCRWYETADRPHANRWIVLIAFLMGLSIGVHLLNLLTIPAFVFMYYYRMNEDKKLPFKKLALVFFIGVVIEFLLVYLFIPYLPKLAAFFDRIFVNGFGLPYNTGALVFMVALLALCFWGLFYTLRSGKVFLNTVLLCVTTLVIGFSLFSIVIIRSSVKTPTNEYQPDNPYTLVRYLSREQYGSTPLLYGQYFDAPYDLKNDKYWAPLNGKYVKADGPSDADYRPEGKMFFPRMWSSADSRYIDFYQMYTNGKGTRIKDATYRKPTFGANMAYFFDYQLNWMYWRYFMWNFVGRQNEIHSPSPGELFYGNWESGVKFIDELRLGDQSDAPAPLRDNKGKNHYFFLPLLLGLLGLVFQFDKDKRGSWIVFLMFFMTGIAIVLYLNQPPFQVRERDYAYAGSFYMFAIWIGLGVVALWDWISQLARGNEKVVAIAASVLCLGVPALMAEENWDDHDRSNRYTSTEMASNYLNSVGRNGLLVTHGDNDTFPLWYAQEIEGVRTDVRVVNTSLLGTDWYIDQMKWASNESAPLPLTVPKAQYLYGTNEFVYITYDDGSPMLLSDVMDIFKDPKMKVTLNDGTKMDFICARKLVMPVNKENCLKYGIVPEIFADQIPESITLTISEDKNYITKPELFMLDLLSNYQWDRPLSMLNMGGDLKIGVDSYLMYDGFSYRFTPIKNKITSSDPGIVDALELYDRMKNLYKWDAIKRDDYFVDYQNLYTFLGVLSQRQMFVSAANALIDAKEDEKALEMLDLCQERFPDSNFPLESLPLGFSGNDYMVAQMIEDYYFLGAEEKARDLAGRMCDALMETAAFYLSWGDMGSAEFEAAGRVLLYIADVMKQYGDKDLSGRTIDRFEALLRTVTGPSFDDLEGSADSLTVDPS
ncbi:MAG: DUF2723 domain-containing protein [Bacteroidales bacterium]|nr:DUF2723 domain-containing protein [Bacteroidales bacterium]